jgi:hypothetical protein
MLRQFGDKSSMESGTADVTHASLLDDMSGNALGYYPKDNSVVRVAKGGESVSTTIDPS